MAENTTTTFYEISYNISIFHCTHDLKQNKEQSTAKKTWLQTEMIQSKSCKFLCSTPLQFLGRGKKNSFPILAACTSSMPTFSKITHN